MEELSHRKKIMEGANVLFKQRQTCKNVTMDEIAASIGISKRTIYECFEDKNSLVSECMDYLLQEMYDRCKQVVEEAEHAFDYFFQVIRIIHFHLKEVYPLVNELKIKYPEVFKRIISSHEIFVRTNTYTFFKRAQREGFIREDIDVEFFLAVLEMNMFYSSKPEFIKRIPQGDIEQQKYMILFTIIRGGTTVKGIEYMDEFFKREKLNNKK